MRTVLSILVLFAASVSSGAAQYNWNANFDGSWEDSTKWSLAGYPQVAGDIAYFGSTSFNRTITVGLPVVVGSIIFNDFSQTYSILSSGLGSITLDVTAGSAGLTVQNGSHTIGVDLTFADPVQVGVDWEDTLTLSGTLTGTTAMTVDSTSSNGKLVLSGDNSLTYSGSITLVEGVISLGHASGMGSGTLSVNNTAGTTVLRTQGADYTISNPLNLSNSATFELGASGSGNMNIAGTVTLSRPAGYTHVVTVPYGEHTFSGAVVEANAGAKFLKKGSGTLVFSGLLPNTFTGALQIEEGTVVLNKTASVAAISGDVEIGRGTSGTHILRLDADNQIADASIIYIDPSGSGVIARFDLNDHDETIGGIDMDGGTIQSGTGTLTLAGNLNSNTDTYQNATVSGNLSLGGGARIFDVSDNSSIENDLSISAIISNGGISKRGSGTLELTAANTFASGFSMSAGTVSIGNDAALGTGTATFTGGTIKANSTTARIVPNNVTVGGNVTIGGAGSLTFQNAVWTLTGNRTVTVNNTANTTIASTITQDGSARSFTKAGAGNLIVTGKNTFSGGFRMNEGIVTLGNDSALGSGTLTLAGGTIQAEGTTPRILSQTVTQSGNVTVGGSGAITFDGSGTYWTISGDDRTITVDSSEPVTIVKTINADYQTRTLTKAGSGTLVLAGSNANVFNQSSGSTIVNEGTLVLSKDFSGVIAVRGPVVIGDGTGTSTLRLDGFGNQIGTQSSGNRNITLNAGAAGTALFDLNNLNQTVDALTFTGGSITSGTGTLTLNGNLIGNANSAEATISGNLSLNSGTRTLTIADGAANSDLSVSAIVSSGAINKAGSGTLTLSGANTFAGAVSINAGVLNVRNSSALGTSAGGVSVGSELTPTVAAALELQGGITIANEALTVRGTGISSGGALRNVSGDNAWTGAISLGADSQIGSDSGQLTLGSGGIANGVYGLTFSGEGNIVVAGVIGSGAGTLRKLGAGTLTLSGANTYSGRTTISGGAVAIQSDSALGSAPGSSVADQLVFDGGTLNANATMSLASTRGVSLSSSGGTLDVATGETLLATGPISGVGSLTKSDGGTLVLSAESSFTGSTILSAGTLQISSDANLGSPGESFSVSRLVFSGGALYSSDTFSFDANRGITINPGTTAIVNVGGGATLSAPQIIAGTSGALTKSGGGTLVLGGENTFAGKTTILDGTLQLSADANLGAAPAQFVGDQLEISGGILAASDSFTFSSGRGITLGTDSATISVASGETLTAPQIIAGTGRLTKIGSGILSLTGENTYTGLTIIQDGKLQITSDSGLGIAPGNAILNQLIFDSGTLVANDTFSIHANRGFSLYPSGGTIEVALGKTLTSPQYFDGSGALTKTGPGTLILSGSAFHTGGTVISEGAVRVAGDYSLGDSSATVTLGGGTLQFSSGLSSGRAFAVTAASAFENLANSAVTLSGPIGISNPAHTLTFAGSSGSFVVDAADISGSGSVSVDGTTVRFDTAAGYSGSTSVRNGGVLRAGGSEVFPSSITLDGTGTPVLDLDGYDQTLATLNSSLSTARVTLGSADLTISSSSSSDFAGSLRGTGSLTKSGSGTLTLSGANNYSGKTTITGGAIAVSADTHLGAAPGLAVADQLKLDGGTLIATDTFSSSANRGITLAAGGGEINVASSRTLTAPQIITGSGNLIKSGTGTLVLSGLNTYSGRTTISGGTVRAAADSALGTAPEAPVANQLTLNNGTLQATDTFSVNANRGISVGSSGATLSVDSGETLTVASSLEGSGSLTKSGTGTLVLSGSSSLTGNVIVESGTVTVLTDLRSSGGFIMNGGVLSGTGQLPATVLNTGSFISPGNSPGTSESTSQTWAGGSGYIWDINKATGTQGQDPGWDLLSITDNLNITATSSSKFTVQARTLSLSNASGPMTDFDNTQTYTWTIATAGSITGFDSSKFTIDSSGFLNDRNGGTLRLIEANNSIALQFVPVPEPEHYAFAAGLLLMGFAMFRRVKAQRTSACS